jgi:hypothetical protein
MGDRADQADRQPQQGKKYVSLQALCLCLSDVLGFSSVAFHGTQPKVCSDFGGFTVA